MSHRRQWEWGPMKDGLYELRPFELSDLKLINPFDDEKDVVESLGDFMNWLVANWDGDRRCGTAFYNGSILYIVGCFEPTPGVSEIFLVPDKSVCHYPSVFMRSLLRWLRWIESRPWCHRTQTHSIPNERIDRFMQSLNFVDEDVEKTYTINGKDYRYKLWGREKVNGLWRNTKRSKHD